MDLFQPYMQLRFMSNAPIWTKITAEHIHKGNGVGAVRATQSNSPELQKHHILANSGIHFVTSKIMFETLLHVICYQWNYSGAVDNKFSIFNILWAVYSCLIYFCS